MFTSWRTSMLGIAAILTSLGQLGMTLKAQFDGDATTIPDWDATLVALSAAFAGAGLMNARDNKVTSAQVKAAEVASHR